MLILGSVTKPKSRKRTKSKSTSTDIIEENMRTVSSVSHASQFISVVVIISKVAGFHSYTHPSAKMSPGRKENGERISLTGTEKTIRIGAKTSDCGRKIDGGPEKNNRLPDNTWALHLEK